MEFLIGRLWDDENEPLKAPNSIMTQCHNHTIEVIAKPPKTSHAKFAKYAKFCFMDDFANLADFA